MLTHLRGLSSLEWLGLQGCSRVTDQGLIHLNGLTRMKRLYLNGCNVTDKGLQAVRAALPGCEIRFKSQ
jgi:F-box/leucine-rich repeat protein 14